MDTDNILTLAGLFLTGLGMLGAVTRLLMTRMDDQAAALHERISDLRDDVERGYVPRETFDIRIAHMMGTLDEIRVDMKLLLRSPPPTSPHIAAE